MPRYFIVVTLSVSDLKWTQHRVEKVVSPFISGEKPIYCANLRSHAPDVIKLLTTRLSKIIRVVCLLVANQVNLPLAQLFRKQNSFLGCITEETA